MVSSCSGSHQAERDKAALDRLSPAGKAMEAPGRLAGDAPVSHNRVAAAPLTVATPAGAEATRGGDGSAIHLNPLAPVDIQSAKLPGELGCSFTTLGTRPLLLAMGNVASTSPARGVVKIMDSVEQVTARAPGGFGAILNGGTFVGKGKVVTVTLAGPAPVTGGESPAFPATLIYDRADGARRSIRGLWSCGP
jgi:hypothetical protein